MWRKAALALAVDSGEFLAQTNNLNRQPKHCPHPRYEVRYICRTTNACTQVYYSRSITQLFIKRNNIGHVTLLVVTVADDILSDRQDSVSQCFVELFDENFKLGSICYDCRKLPLNKLWIDKYEDFYC